MFFWSSVYSSCRTLWFVLVQKKTRLQAGNLADLTIHELIRIDRSHAEISRLQQARKLLAGSTETHKRKSGAMIAEGRARISEAPMTYMHKSKQFLVVATGGANLPAELIAFTL